MHPNADDKPDSLFRTEAQESDDETYPTLRQWDAEAWPEDDDETDPEPGDFWFEHDDRDEC